MKKVYIFYTMVASDIAKSIFIAWLDGWQIPWESLKPEDWEILSEHGFLEWNIFYKTYVEGEKFASGNYEISSREEIICPLGTERT